MAFRNFRDSRGRSWAAWDVVPQLVERRKADRRRTARPLSFSDRRDASDRRVAQTPRASLGDGLDRGWLCFEGDAEKRRLAPVPGDWTQCADARLEEYLEQAAPVKKKHVS